MPKWDFVDKTIVAMYFVLGPVVALLLNFYGPCR